MSYWELINDDQSLENWYNDLESSIFYEIDVVLYIVWYSPLMVAVITSFSFYL